MTAQATHLDGLLLTLSATQYKEQVTSDLFRSSKNKKLLSLIALLLVTQAQGDVAAVTMRSRQVATVGTIATFYYVKNRGCNAQESAYIQQLVSIASQARSGADPATCAKRMIELVQSNCQAKIKHRFVRLGQAVRQLSDVPIVGLWTEPSLAVVNRFFAQLYGNGEAYLGLRLSVFLNSWFFGVVGGDFPVHDTSAIRRIFKTAFLLGNSSELIASIPSPKLQRRVKKLGNYYGAVGTICREAANARHFNGFQALEVETSDPYFVRPTASPLQILNEVGTARINGYDHILPEQVGNLIPYAADDFTWGPERIHLIKHCECTLAVAALAQAPQPRASRTTLMIEIGISKDCCYPCLIFLEELSLSANLDIRIADCHGKTYRGWRLPTNFPGSGDIGARMENRIRRRLHAILLEVDARRRSDSAAWDSPESDPFLFD